MTLAEKLHNKKVKNVSKQLKKFSKLKKKS